MKKFIFGIIAIFAISFSVETVKAQASILFPTGNATQQTITLAAAKQVTYTLTTTTYQPKNTMNLYTIVGYSATGLDTVLNITTVNSSKLRVGSIMVVTLTSDATARTVTFSAGFKSTTLSGTSSKQKTIAFIYDGTNWVSIGSYQNN